MVHLRRLGALLRGEGKHARPLDADLPQEFTQLLEGSLVLIGQTGDEAGPQHQAGDTLAQLSKHLGQGRLGIPAVHGLQNRVVAVLDWNVQIGQNLGLRRDGVDQLIGDLVRIQVVEPDPVEVQLAQLFQQLRQLVLTVQVRAVAGNVLGDDQ